MAAPAPAAPVAPVAPQPAPPPAPAAVPVPPELRAHPLWLRVPELAGLDPHGFTLPVAAAAEGDALPVFVMQLDAEKSPHAFRARTLEAAVVLEANRNNGFMLDGGDPALVAVLRDMQTTLRQLARGQDDMRADMGRVEGAVQQLTVDVHEVAITVQQSIITRRNRQSVKVGNPMAAVPSVVPGRQGLTCPIDCPARYEALRYPRDVMQMSVRWLDAYLALHALPVHGTPEERRRLLIDFLTGRF